MPEAEYSHRNAGDAPRGPAVAGASPEVAVAQSTAVTGVAGAVQTVINEFGGPPGPDPTRYGDWERAGRCIDF